MITKNYVLQNKALIHHKATSSSTILRKLQCHIQLKDSIESRAEISHLCFTTADLDKEDVKDQVETVDQSLLAGNTTQQQGMVILHSQTFAFTTIWCHKSLCFFTFVYIPFYSDIVNITVSCSQLLYNLCCSTTNFVGVPLLLCHSTYLSTNSAV